MDHRKTFAKRFFGQLVWFFEESEINSRTKNLWNADKMVALLELIKVNWATFVMALESKINLEKWFITAVNHENQSTWHNHRLRIKIISNHAWSRSISCCLRGSRWIPISLPVITRLEHLGLIDMARSESFMPKTLVQGPRGFKVWAAPASRPSQGPPRGSKLAEQEFLLNSDSAHNNLFDGAIWSGIIWGHRRSSSKLDDTISFNYIIPTALVKGSLGSGKQFSRLYVMFRKIIIRVFND